MHRRYCCDRGRWNGFGRKPPNAQNGQNTQNETAAPAPAETAAPAPAKKMRRVTVGAVEMMVEDGATLTIAGVPITFSG